MKKIIILLITLLITTGCSYQEINDLAIVSTLGIDIKDNEYILTAQIMDIKKSENSPDPTTIIYTSSGKTISEAVRNFSTKYPKSIYLGHVELVVLGETIIQNDMDVVLDFFLRSPYANPFAQLIVTKNTSANKLLNPEVEKESSFPSVDIISNLKEATKKEGTEKEITIMEFFKEYIEPGIDPALPILEIDEKVTKKQSNSTFRNLASFKNNVINESLDKNQAVAYNTINNNYYDIVINIPYKNEIISTIVFNPKSKIEVDTKNNVKVNISIKLESRVGESHKNIELLSKKVTDELEKITEDLIQKNVNSLLDYCKKYNVDLLGIKNNIYKHNNKDYDKFKNKNLYEEANFNININVSMYRYGNTYAGNLGGHNNE